MDVFINGFQYVPANKKLNKTGICITTHNRHEVLSQALEHQFKFISAGARAVSPLTAIYHAHLAGHFDVRAAYL